MMIIGADVHKRTHTFVAVTEAGRQVAQTTVPATSSGHETALRWARERFDEQLLWAIEDCRQLSSRLERDLLTGGQQVVRVAPKLMAEHRRISRTHGKSDPIDALAVARAAAREPDLPRATHDEYSRELKLRVDRRETLVRQRTATINSLLGRVHELDPEFPVGSLRVAKNQRALGQWLAPQKGVVAELARDELDDVTTLDAKISAATKIVETLVHQGADELLAIPGSGALTAAKLRGESANITRFSSEKKFASYAGVAPIPVWSGNTAGRVRMTRSGNRQINAALHRIAITQLGMPNSPGRAYVAKKKAEGKSTTEAIRCLKRKLARTVFNHLQEAHNNQARTPQQTAA